MFTCPRCEQATFESVEALRKHRAVVHHDAIHFAREPTRPREEGKRQNNCACPKCGEVFASRKQRHHHQMLMHRQTRLKYGLRPVSELYED